jgi:hypothetical protein
LDSTLTCGVTRDNGEPVVQANSGSTSRVRIDLEHSALDVNARDQNRAHIGNCD